MTKRMDKFLGVKKLAAKLAVVDPDLAAKMAAPEPDLAAKMKAANLEEAEPKVLYKKRKKKSD